MSRVRRKVTSDRNACGTLEIASALSAVMVPPAAPKHFHIHALTCGADGAVGFLESKRVDIS